MGDRPLYQMSTPALVIGRSASAVLKPLFERMGYGDEVATYADTVGDARAILRLETMPPPAILIIEPQEGAEHIVCSVCKLNRDLRVICMGDEPRGFRADLTLPLQVSYETFSEKYHYIAMAHAMSVGGMRGAVDADLDAGCEQCEH